MPEFQVHHAVPYAPRQMFDVVANIEAYPQFVPHCAAIRVLSREKKTENVEIVTARMTIGYKIFTEHYVSRITLDKEALAIDVAQTQGPFKYLINTWRFAPAGTGTKIDFYLNYEFRSRALGLMMGPLFRKLFGNFEAAFERRAQALHA